MMYPFFCYQFDESIFKLKWGWLFDANQMQRLLKFFIGLKATLF